MIRPSLISIAALALLTANTLSAAITTTTYDWSPNGDQGTLGWTNLMIDPANANTGTPYQLQDIGNQYGSPKGALGNLTNGAQDVSHDTLVFQSPEFTVDPTTSVDFSLSEGSATTTLVSNIAGLPASSSIPGYVGLALMQVSTGDYLLNFTKSVNGGIEAGTFTTAQITGATAGLPTTETYVLQLIDYKHGGWGHVALRDIELTNVCFVPEPSVELSLLFAFGLIAIRRR